MTKHRITQITPHDSPGTQLSDAKEISEFLVKFRPTACLRLEQEALLPHTDRATRCVSQNLANCCIIASGGAGEVIGRVRRGHGRRHR